MVFFRPLLIMALVLGMGCSTSKETYEQKRRVESLKNSIFEVVTPKVEDKNVVYATPLPVDKLPYQTRTDPYYSVGTAFYVGGDRFVSAAHVFSLHLYSNVESFLIRGPKGNTYPISGFTRYSQYRDLVEFTVEGRPPGLEALKLGKFVSIGESVLTVGNALGQGISVRRGEVASYTPEPQNGAWMDIRYSAPVSPGNSGGPLLNEDLEVIGVVTSRTQNENLNFAVPIEEYRRLSKSQAEFYFRKQRYAKGDQFLEKDLGFDLGLPKSLSVLRREAEGRLRTFRKELEEEFRKTRSQAFFPNNRGSKEYLRKQEYSPYLAFINRRSEGAWQLVVPQYKRYQLPSGQLVFAESRGGSHYTLIEKPPGMRLKRFIQDPKLFLEGFFRAVSWNRQYAGETVKILSYGNPGERRAWRDRQGRPYVTSHWRLKFNDSLLLSTCTPVPRGLACFLDSGPASLETANLGRFYQNNSQAIALSYSGSLSHWKEFLSLPYQHLPSWAKGARIALGNLGTFSLDLPKSFRVNFDAQKLDLNQSALVMLLGFNPKRPTRQEIQGFRLFPNETKPGNFSLLKVYRPLQPKEGDAWKSLAREKAPYDGKPFSKGDSTYIQVVVKNNKAREVAGEKESVFLVTCQGGADVQEQALAKQCQRFIQRIKVAVQ